MSSPALPFSPNPNIYQTPSLQPKDCAEWAETGNYFMGDCVLRGATFNNDTQKWEGGEMFMLLALVGNTTFNEYVYGNVGVTSDPIFSSLSLKSNGVDFNNNWIGSTPNQTTANPGGAQWVNLSLLTPQIPPWNKERNYGFGDLVYYPDPTIVWRFSVDTVGLPNVTPPGITAFGGNTLTSWSLISNPQQYTAFNPNPPVAPSLRAGSGDNVVVSTATLPPTRPAPL